MIWLVHICEIRGSGFERMEEGMRDWKIPAPKVETGDDFCRTMLFWHESLSKWSKEEKIRTCYLYVCYCYENGIEVSNAVFRDRKSEVLCVKADPLEGEGKDPAEDKEWQSVLMHGVSGRC